MKIGSEQRNVTVSGMLNQREFSVQNSAHIMQVLSGLYKKPTEAMLREYLTNMFDAYQALKRVNPSAAILPPRLHLPSQLDNNLTFTDYGIGMSIETVWAVYTQYGATTKNGNNDEVGGFGLGSKTAFCYNNGASWSIESRYDGMKHLFMAFVGANDVPNLTHVSSQPTDEHSGVTVSIPIRREHIQEVIQAAELYVPYFPMELVVEGAKLKAQAVEYDFKGTNWGARKFDAARHAGRGMHVLMGNVPYLLSDADLDKIISSAAGRKTFDKMYQSRNYYAQREILEFLSYNYFTVETPIGSVDIVPSRDSLKFTDRTNAQLLSLMNNIFVEMPGIVSDKFKDAKTEYDAIKQAHQFKGIKGFHLIVDALKWRGKTLGGDIVRSKDEILKADKDATWSTYTLSDYGIATPTVTELPDTITFDALNKNHLYSVVMDDIGNGVARLAQSVIRSRWVNKHHSGRTARYGHKTGTLLVMKTKLSQKEISDLFGGIPVEKVELASVLKGVVPAIKGSVVKDTIYRFNGSSWDARVNPPKEAVNYYLPLEQNYVHRWVPSYNKEVINQLRSIVGRDKNTSITVYGVKKNDVVNLDKSWKNLMDVAIDVMKPLVTKHADDLVIAKADVPANLPTLVELFSQTGVNKMSPICADLMKWQMTRETAEKVVRINEEKINTMIRNSDTFRIFYEKTIADAKAKSTFNFTPEKIIESIFAKYPMIHALITLHTDLRNYRYYGGEHFKGVAKFVRTEVINNK